MASEFTGFEVKVSWVTEVDGVERLLSANVPAATVLVRDITDADPATGAGAVALDDLEADGQGFVAGGMLDVDAGRTVRFSWLREEDGACNFAELVTT